MQDKVILGVDISKKTFDVCLKLDEKQYHKVFKNNIEGFKQCLAWCQSHGAETLWVCLEATSWYSEGLAEYAYQQNHTVSLINPARIKAYAQSKGLRHKNDKTDARVIAEFCYSQQPTIWTPLSLEVRYLRDLLRTFEALKQSHKSLMNRLENETLHEEAKHALEAIGDSYTKEIKNLEKIIKEKVEQSENLKEKVTFIKDIKGIGFLTAVTLLTEMPSIENFQNAREYVAFAGLNPRQYQSGSSVRRKNCISKIGSSRVRKMLFMPALVVKNNNDYFKPFCNRLAARGKCPKIIIVAIMRKLMHIIFGMLKNNAPFNPVLAFSVD